MIFGLLKWMIIYVVKYIIRLPYKLIDFILFKWQVLEQFMVTYDKMYIPLRN